MYNLIYISSLKIVSPVHFEHDVISLNYYYYFLNIYIFVK